MNIPIQCTICLAEAEYYYINPGGFVNNIPDIMNYQALCSHHNGMAKHSHYGGDNLIIVSREEYICAQVLES